MPIKVSDFLTHVNSYPVVRVEDNVILGYAYSTAFTQEALEAVPANNRRAGLLLANRALYAYQEANTTNAYWGDLTKYKEIAVKFSSYPYYPTTIGANTYDTIGEALANTDDDDVFFAVHKDSNNTFYKLASNNVIEWLVNALVQVQIAEGYGTITSYTGNTGIVGDLNGDGQVSTADLLIFLGAFGSGASWVANTAFESVFVYFANTTSISLLAASGTSTYVANTQIFFPLDTGITVNSGAFTTNINNATSEPYIEFTGTTNGSQVITLVQFANTVVYTLQNIQLSIEASTPSGAGNLIFGVKVEKYQNTTLLANAYSLDILNIPISSAGTFSTIPLANYNIGSSIGNNFSNGSNISYTQAGTPEPLTKIRFKFYAKYSTNNAVINSVKIQQMTFIAAP